MSFDERARDLLASATYEDVWCLLVACKIKEGQPLGAQHTSPASSAAKQKEDSDKEKQP